MPIRFACDHCNSVLSVSSRKAGQEVTCPKCRQKTPVPVPTHIPATVAAEVTRPADAKIAPAAAPPPESISKSTVRPPEAVAEVALAPPGFEPSAPDPVIETVDDGTPAVPPAFSFDSEFNSGDEVTWVYEADTAGEVAGSNAGTVDFDRVSLPRYVLYGQGALLLAVAIMALTLGILIGRGSAPRVAVKSGTATPCYLTGTVQHRTSGGNPVADGGAVVIVVPQDQRPAEKAPIEGLRPEDPLPEADQPSLARIKSIGGDYARADEQGYFKVRVPDSGEYFLLVVSHHAGRKAGQRLDPVHLAQMGRYFLPAPDLVGDRYYRWRSESIKRDKQYSIIFE